MVRPFQERTASSRTSRTERYYAQDGASCAPTAIIIPRPTPSSPPPLSSQVVTVLLREGADRDAEDVNGYHPLHYATMWGHTTTITALVEAGAALESATRVDGNRPLHIAARYASAATVQHLLRQGEEKAGAATPAAWQAIQFSWMCVLQRRRLPSSS